MTFNLLPSNLTPSEGEDTVRTYHCTTMASRLLAMQAEGYLTVTNMRVVFYAQGSSYSGKSILHSELPIADASGISTYKGTYFSLSHLFGAFIAAFVVGNIVGAVVSALVRVLLGLVMRNVFDPRAGQATSIVLAILAIVAIIWSRSYPSDNIRRPILATIGAILLAGPGGFSLFTRTLGSLLGGDVLSTLLLIAAIVTGIYALVTMFQYARRETMSLAIGSKGGASTPIAISGLAGFGLFNTAALRALSAEPAQQAESMIKELGAVITDIQTLGDEGINKWKVE